MKELEQENNEQTESPEREKMLNTVKVRKGAVHMWATESSNRRVTTQHTLMASTLKTQVSGKVLVVPHFHHFVFCARGGMPSKCDSLYIPFRNASVVRSLHERSHLCSIVSVQRWPFKLGFFDLRDPAGTAVYKGRFSQDRFINEGL